MNYLFRAKEFKAKKKLGQNFLIDENIINRIVDESCLNSDNDVLEIGGGIGFVTENLVKHAKNVFVVELDDEAIPVLKKIPADNLNIIHQDILKTDLSQISDKKLKVVANIPYYITGPIIAHLLGEIDDLENKNRNSISEIVMMVQYEVAKRIVATEKSPSKEYGLLSILSQFWANVEYLETVSNRAFYPSPKVNSALVKFKIRQKPLLELKDYKFFRKFVKAAFSSRRKNIKNALLNGGYPKEPIIEALKIMNSVTMIISGTVQNLINVFKSVSTCFVINLLMF